MRAIRWDERPEARQLAGLGKKLSRAAQSRLRWMLFYYFNGQNAARTCRRFGISRRTFYRWRRRFDRHDLRTLEELSHRPHQVRQPTWTAQLAERVLALRQQYPRWGKDKLVVLLRREKRTVSTSMVGSRPSQLFSGRRGGNCENVPGRFASLNTGELQNPGIWWRSTPKRFTCAVA